MWVFVCVLDLIVFGVGFLVGCWKVVIEIYVVVVYLLRLFVQQFVWVDQGQDVLVKGFIVFQVELVQLFEDDVY